MSFTAIIQRNEFTSSFQGYFGKIVYTGDFRFNNAMVEEPPLRGICDVDVLYLDNSYCHPQCVFPTRSEALNTIIHIIEQHPGKAAA